MNKKNKINANTNNNYVDSQDNKLQNYLETLIFLILLYVHFLILNQD